MDPFTQRMLERAKARREKLDTQLSNAGHVVKVRRSPLKDANTILLQSKSSNEDAKKLTDKYSASNVLNTESATVNLREEAYNSSENSKIIKAYSPDKENGAKMDLIVRSKLQRMGKLYSNDACCELSSPIHRTEEEFSAEEKSIESKDVKRVGGTRLDRLAALASTINNWEDDLSHPLLVKIDDLENSKYD
ncbi:hypothetical protein PV327_010010 [Microctonus hyperodae]|uniref:Anillin N-terminal domain-containing protein n=1 Tax=Microctonus hyperodae TaxID=165561 RepID=A0AA39F268_MICHY|nr:hypothetical protein PV327_010010 [Microctonus hyperodae]